MQKKYKLFNIIQIILKEIKKLFRKNNIIKYYIFSQIINKINSYVIIKPILLIKP